LQNIICYNEREVKEGQGSKEDIKKGYNPQIDVVNPTESDLFNLQQSFNPDNKALENYENTRIFFENLKDWRADLSPTAELSLPLLHHLVSYEYTTRI
jgi:hypothetical protein